MVTGRIGACGKTKRTAAPSSSSSFTIGTKSLPSAPRPCIQMTAAAGFLPVSSSMTSSFSVFAIALDPAEAPRRQERRFRALDLAVAHWRRGDERAHEGARGTGDLLDRQV